jgi:hypothetical protein
MRESVVTAQRRIEATRINDAVTVTIKRLQVRAIVLS